MPDFAIDETVVAVLIPSRGRDSIFWLRELDFGNLEIV
jgi:hypothetical protein